MQHSRLTKIAVRVTAALAAILLGIASLSVLERRRTQAELNAVLSAFFSDVVLRDTHESRSGRSIQVIIPRDGPPSAYWRARWLNLLLDRRTLFPQASPATRSSFLLSNAVTTETPAELHLPKGVDFVVLSRSELERAQNLDRHSLDDMEYFAVSQLGLNFSKTEAILYIEYSCFRVTDTCSGGYFMLMRKANGVWKVVDRSDTWAS